MSGKYYMYRMGGTYFTQIKVHLLTSFFSSDYNFWSRKPRGTVDTALESWDLELSDNKILGTIGVPCFSLECHLWAGLAKFSCFSRRDKNRNCVFWVPWVTPWYPKFFVLKSMMSQLSNAVSHGCVWLLVRFVECFEVWEFLTILTPKVEILKNTWNLGKIIHFYSCCNFRSREATGTVDKLRPWTFQPENVWVS